MNKWKMGAVVIGLGTSAILAGCVGKGIETPEEDQPTGIEEALGVAPRTDRFATAPKVSLEVPRLRVGASTADLQTPGELKEVHAAFDPAIFREGAEFRAKLEVK